MAATAATMTIEVVSDVVCPWCAVGVSSLMRAIEQLEGEVKPRIRFEPFELNPTLGPGGADIVDYLSRKYGSTPSQIEQMHAKIAERGASVGFAFSMDKRSRTYNTFDAHRLLLQLEVAGREVLLHEEQQDDSGEPHRSREQAGEVEHDEDERHHDRHEYDNTPPQKTPRLPAHCRGDGNLSAGNKRRLCLAGAHAGWPAAAGASH